MAGLQLLGKSVAADAVTTEQLASGEALGVGSGISTRTRQENDSDVPVCSAFLWAFLRSSSGSHLRRDGLHRLYMS